MEVVANTAFFYRLARGQYIKGGAPEECSGSIV
jgi:hypothetical protein